MARVFVPPRYSDTINNTILNLASNAESRSAFLDAAYDTYISMSPNDESAELEEAVDLGRKKGYRRVDAWLKLCDEVRSLCLGKTTYADDHAMYAFVNRVTSGNIAVTDGNCMRASAVDALARETAMIGAIASFASPHLAAKKAMDVLLPHSLKRSCPESYRAACVDLDLRLHCSEHKVRRSFRSIMSGMPIDYEDPFKLSSARIAHTLSSCSVYAIGPILVIIHADEAFVFDPISRAFTSDIFRTYAQWATAAHGTHGDDGFQAALMSIRYVISSQAAVIGDVTKLRKLARQMKSSYAILQCTFARNTCSAEEEELITSQILGLHAEVEEARCAESPWINCLLNINERIAIDIGTAWHLLPPPDCDARATNAAIKAKYNSKRPGITADWTDFISYSASAISAHYLVNNPNTQVLWDTPGAEDFPWVKSCRTGTLAYADRSNRAQILGAFEWQHHIENWGWTTQDVTHVWADSSGTADATIDNELEYFIEHGSLFSGKYTPEDIRAAWRAADLPGTRTLYAAVKSENTKVPGKQRETMSADDVTRECLTEIDMNVAKVARLINGVSSRAGRTRTEVMTNNVLKKVHNGGLLVSLDVSGWSPNMNRKGELAFADMLLRFFSGTDRGSASDVFRRTFVMFAKSGMSDFWEAVDGSIQGFFGTTDSILHSMMAQWCIMRMKEDGSIDKTATIDKLTLIDDILVALTGLKLPPSRILALFISYYGKLGFAVDAVKTIARANVGIFLNRFYANGEEVVTCNKISAKADRAFESQWITPAEECSSVFNAFVGASDRGACPMATYTAAVHRCFMRLAEYGGDILRRSMLFSHVQAWLPQSLGGLGFPSISSWLTRASPDALDTCVANVFTVRNLYSNLADAYPAGRYAAVRDEIDKYLKVVANQKFEQRSAVATATDPLVVRIDRCNDPSTVRARLAREGFQRMNAHHDLKALFALSSSDEYEQVIAAVLAAGSWPADIISEWAACLPHSVATEVRGRIESCDRILRHAGKRKRESAWAHFKRASREYVSVMSSVLTGEPGNATMDAIIYTQELRSRAFGRFTFVNCMAPSPAAFIAQSASDDDLKIFLAAPACTNVNATPTGFKSSLRRSAQSSHAEGGIETSERDPGPVAKCVRRFSALLSYAATASRDSTLLEDTFSLLWTGRAGSIVVPRKASSVSNTFRICNRFSSVKHTVAAYPNVTPHVKVAATAAINRLESIPRAFSWLSVVYFLKAAAVCDIACGNRDAINRQYTVVPSVVNVKADSIWPRAPCPDVEIGYAPFAQVVSAACKSLAAQVPIDDEIDLASVDVTNDNEVNTALAALADRSKHVAFSVLATAAAGSLMSALSMGSVITNASTASVADVSASASNNAKKAERTSGLALASSLRSVIAAAIDGYAEGGVAQGARDASAAWAREMAGKFTEAASHEDKWARKLFSTDEHTFLSGLADARIATNSLLTPGNIIANYEVLSAEHYTKSINDASPKAIRYRSHFISSMIGTIAADRCDSYVNAVISAIRGYGIACAKMIQRSDGKAFTEVNTRFRSAILNAPGASSIADACKSVFNEVIGDDFADKDVAVAGSVGAVRAVTAWLAKDFLEPEAIAQRIQSSTTVFAMTAEDDEFELPSHGTADFLGMEAVSDQDITRWIATVSYPVTIEEVRSDPSLIALVIGHKHEDHSAANADV